MNKGLEEQLEEWFEGKLEKISKMDPVDIMEAMSGGSKSAERFWNSKRRGCTDGNIIRLCINCTRLHGKNIYGKRKCKSYRKHNNMDIAYFQSNKELARDIIQKAMKKA